LIAGYVARKLGIIKGAQPEERSNERVHAVRCLLYMISADNPSEERNV
jgi:hypothetical protein